MTYDGTTRLNQAVADLIECSPKNNNKLAKVIGQAKKTLGITCKARKLPAELNQKIYQHLVELYSQPTDDESVEIILQNTEPAIAEPENTQQTPVELFSHTNNFDNVRIAFYIMRDGKRERQVISLDGYFINALASIKVLKQDVPQWVQAQVNEWTAFDSKLPITRQVKYLIMREVVSTLSGSGDVFHAPINIQ